MKLFLQDGTAVEGKSFGVAVPAFGEVVFTTGMVGYVETLTDPSYAGQIIVFTEPLIGNYGVPGRSFFESKRIWASGVIVSSVSEHFKHADAEKSFTTWIKEAGIPALSEVDTRCLTKKLRTHGVMNGYLGKKKPRSFFDATKGAVSRVSPSTPSNEGNGTITVVLVDCGAKENIMRSLLQRGVQVRRVPWNYDFTKESYDGVVFSNGPGNPMECNETIVLAKKVMKAQKPILGICLGTQILALASGARTYKLPFGHRSQNQPCIDLTNRNGRCSITSQNHGYAVDAKSLRRGWRVWFQNANDGSVEGITHDSLPFSAVQFHPEASPGPTDTAWVFDNFVALLRKKN